VRARREQLGWFQADLAKASRTHHTYISRLEAGKVNPSLDVIVDVAFALGLNVATLTADLLPRERRQRRRGKTPGRERSGDSDEPTELEGATGSGPSGTAWTGGLPPDGHAPDGHAPDGHAPDGA